MARDITQLHPEAQRLALLLVEKCEEQGLKIKITDCVRSKAEQDALYAQGRTTKGLIITNVKYPNSRHNWGDAFDFCRADGKGAYNDSDGFFAKVGAIGKSIGLEWGGDWKSFKDKPHFQLAGWGSTCSKLKAAFGTPEKYRASWKTSDTETSDVKTSDKNYLEKGDSGSEVKEMQTMLIAVGFSCGSKGADGEFGNNTEKAVKKFQEFYGLTIDGLYGAKTSSKLKSVYKTKLAEIEAAAKAPAFTVGKTYTLQTELKVRTGAGTEYHAKRHSELTADGRKHDKDKDGCLDAGTKVTCKRVKKVGSDIWIKTPSGWLAAFYKGKVYIK